MLFNRRVDLHHLSSPAFLLGEKPRLPSVLCTKYRKRLHCLELEEITESMMATDQTVERLAGLEVDLINRIWECVNEEEDAFAAISRQLVADPDRVDLQNFINHALTGVLLAVAYFRFRETMTPFLDHSQIEEAFMRMAQSKAKNVVDHWHERPQNTAH